MILVSLGVASGYLTQGILTMVTVVGVITITLSSYLILYEERIFNKISRFLSVFEKKKLREEK